jgi:phosphatidylglycerophosphatase C
VSASAEVVAAFDVDGTLTVRDCVRPFLELVAGRLGVAAAFAKHPLATAGGALRRDRDRLKAVVVGGVFAGREVATVVQQGRGFADTVATTMLRPDTVARLRWHQARGHRTVLVSASLRPYLEPLAARLGVGDVLCTDVAQRDGRYLAALDGPNCRADEKARRLRGWLSANGVADAEVWAYGDSRGDRELLAMAHHPVWVHGTTLQPAPAGEGR